LKDVASLKGLKFRVGGFAGTVLAKLGVVPQQIPASDIYPALERGTIDAAEWVGPHDDEKLGFYKVAKFYYTPGWWEGGTVLHYLTNLDKWESLPRNYKAALTAAAAFANSLLIARFDSQNPIALKRLLANGTQLRSFSPAIMSACLKAANDVYAETSAQNADFKKVWDNIKAFRNMEYEWWQVAEFNYDNFMVRTAAR